MKKTLLLVMTLMPLWLFAEDFNVIKFTPKTSDANTIKLSSINKLTFADGKLVTSFYNGDANIETTLIDLSKVTFTTDISKGLSTTASEAMDYTLYPMPVQEQLTLSFTAKQAATATITIINLDGRTMLHSTHALQAGSNRLQLSTADLARGTYICRLSYGNEQYSQQIIKTVN